MRFWGMEKGEFEDYFMTVVLHCSDRP
jgi:hypothetical protein